MTILALAPLGLLSAAPVPTLPVPTPPLPSPVAKQAAPNPTVCDNRPVVMLVEGTIRDAARLNAYADAIRSSGLYQQLGGYYLVNPRPVAVFEGAAPPERSLLAVRFPCLAHARAFWNSKIYREKIVPLRSNPSAGDFVVTVHLELSIPAYMHDRVVPAAYGAKAGSMTGIEQIGSGVR